MRPKAESTMKLIEKENISTNCLIIGRFSVILWIVIVLLVIDTCRNP